jgi:hypothetical protein
MAGESTVVDIESRVHKIVQLKNFAISKGYALPDNLIEDLAKLEIQIKDSTFSAIGQTEIVKIDKIIRDLCEITYPINIANIDKVTRGEGVTRFAYIVLATGLAAALACGAFIWIIKIESGFAEGVKSPLAIFLGIVGAVIYVMLPNGRINTIAGLDPESVALDLFRIFMGGILGFVIYIVNSDFLSLKAGGAAYGLLAPLVGGYSISLVVGILAKAVTAIELTLNLDEKRSQASLRK